MTNLANSASRLFMLALALLVCGNCGVLIAYVIAAPFGADIRWIAIVGFPLGAVAGYSVIAQLIKDGKWPF